MPSRHLPNSYTPSQADVTVFKAVGSAPSSQYPHAARWYSHIESYSSEHSSLPGDSSKSAEDLVPKAASTSAPTAKAAAPEEDDDDEVDLFGSDDEEEDEAAAKLKAERVAAYTEKKAGKVKPAAKVGCTPSYLKQYFDIY